MYRLEEGRIMRASTTTWLPALAALAFLATTSAFAQNPYAGSGIQGRYTRPTVSPYLNLLRGGNTAVNYYDLVRPQLYFNNSIQQLRQDVTLNQQGIADVASAQALPVTGHPSTFLNYSGYFMSTGRGSAGAVFARPSLSVPASGSGTINRAAQAGIGFRR
jgi:hypothetical protein